MSAPTTKATLEENLAAAFHAKDAAARKYFTAVGVVEKLVSEQANPERIGDACLAVAAAFAEGESSHKVLTEASAALRIFLGDTL